MTQHQLETIAYTELGKERTQVFPVDLVPSYQNYWKSQGSKEIEAYDVFWRSRRDVRWVEFPGKFEWNKHVKKAQFRDLITEILMDLEPTSTFNPGELWASIKNAAAEKPVKSRSKDEKIKIVNSVTRSKVNLLREITQIRNSRGDLLGINRTIGIPEARAILLVEILASAISEFDACVMNRTDTTQAKKLIYELLWILENVDPKIRARSIAFRGSDIRGRIVESLPADIQKDKNFLEVFMKDTWKTLRDQVENDKTLLSIGRHTDLVADSQASIDAMITRARTIRDGESDIIRFQLFEMSDCLPPLSRFIFGHSLDPWQMKVLTWIDEGKSVVISAPTSSGKTVLSTYVAVIFKNDLSLAADFQRLSISNADDFSSSTRHERVNVDDEEEEPEIVSEGPNSFLPSLVEIDRVQRFRYLSDRKTLLNKKEANPRVLFVVPTEPLVWQVAAYFTKLLKVEGDSKTKVGLVTEQMTFNPSRVFGVMPQIVVGTPQALESALSKPRGLSGEFESSKVVAGDILPGGYENFDWVIYDEVHALDSEEGAALQRIIRAMNCPFLALSATVGNADRLREWFEQVRGDQSQTVQSLTIPTVEAIVHQTRFINLQRYIWDQEAPATQRLQEVNPLAAILDAQSLQNGVLANSSLSFTSKDCVRVWDAIAELYPAADVQALSPHTFFRADERITLARLKEYEDLLKQTLPVLAASHPVQTEELLRRFQINEPARDVNLCEMLLELKAKDMTPCLPFHLNTFEAIKLFQQVLAELEWMQHVTFPTYYTDRIRDQQRRSAEVTRANKSHGGNAKEAEEAERAGDGPEAVIEVDIHEPHPVFVLSKSIPLNATEMRNLIDEIERFDGFKAREKQAMNQNPGENIAIIEHPLIRGLKRGIGLFVDEISFPSYRRAVQKLASQGKLGVVISDTSLAFGVNMPFRSCIFCGEMSGQLDELMAQQMSGRAGRRGLDNQGNIIYAGIRLNLMRRLMVGKISDLTGQYSPNYSTLALQPILSPRHVGYARAHTIGGKSLSQFLASEEAENVLEESKRTLVDLGFLSASRNSKGVVSYIPSPLNHYNYALLSIMWEMRRYPYESITLGMFFNHIVAEFHPIVRELSIVDRKLKLEVMEPHIHTFFVIMTQLVCRVAWRPRPELHYTPPKMSEVPYFAVQSRREVLEKWTNLFAKQQGAAPADGEMEHIPDAYAFVRDPIGPGVELDGTLLMCCLDHKYVHTLDDVHKQEMKALIWRLGSLLKIMHNCAKTDSRYVRVVYFVLNNAFKKIQHLLAELIVAVIDFDDCSSYGRERRKSRPAGAVAASAAATSATATVPVAPSVLRWDDMTVKQVCDELLRRLRDGQMNCTDEEDRPPAEVEDWSDLRTESFVDAIDAVLSKLNGDLSVSNIWSIAYDYRALHQCDVPLLRFLGGAEGTFDQGNEAYMQKLVEALATSSFAGHFGEISRIGFLLWYCAVRVPDTVGLTSFAILLQRMVRAGYVSIEALAQWDAASLEDAILLFPSSYRNYRVRSSHCDKISRVEESAVTAEHFAAAKAGAASLLQTSYAAGFSAVLAALTGTTGATIETVRALSLPYATVLRNEADFALIHLMHEGFAAKKAVTLLAETSFVQQLLQATPTLTRGALVLGLLTHLVSNVLPAGAYKTAVPLLLKFLYDAEIVDEESILAWHAADTSALLPTLPSSYLTARVKPLVVLPLTGNAPLSTVASQAQAAFVVPPTGKKVVRAVELRTSVDLTAAQCQGVQQAAKQMVDWLQQAEEEEEEEEDDEEEEEEDD